MIYPIVLGIETKGKGVGEKLKRREKAKPIFKETIPENFKI